MGVRLASEGESVSAQMRDDGAAARDEIELEFATIRLRDDGIVDVILKKHTDVTVERAKAMNTAIRALHDGPAPILADIRGMQHSGILTQRYTAGPQVAEVTRRLALLVGSPVSRMLGTAKIGLAKTPYPTRLFTDEDAAVTWLLAGSAEDAADDQHARRRVDDEPAA